MKLARIGGRLVGEGQPCFISFEAGATHTGLKSAKALAKAAAEAGADAVKFQTLWLDELLSDEDQQIGYTTAAGVKRAESVRGALERRHLEPEEWKELKGYCDELGLAFISTPSGPGTVDLLVELGAAAIKISKSDINNGPLLRYVASKGVPVILDARERFSEVEQALRLFEQAGLEDIVIMHCPSGYPAEHAGIHLRAIPVIRKVFRRPVAYSDHSIGEAMNFAAIALGACFLEKTITLNREADAVEHSMSLEPGDLAGFVERVRQVEGALGDPRVVFTSRVKAEHRRSIMTARPIAAGQAIALEDLVFRRPGTYLSVERVDAVVGRTATRELEAGVFLAEADVAPE